MCVGRLQHITCRFGWDYEPLALDVYHQNSLICGDPPASKGVLLGGDFCGVQFGYGDVHQSFDTASQGYAAGFNSRGGGVVVWVFTGF